MPEQMPMQAGFIPVFTIDVEPVIAPDKNEFESVIPDSNEAAESEVAPVESESGETQLEVEVDSNETSDSNQVIDEDLPIMLAAVTTVTSPNDTAEAQEDTEAEFLFGLTFDKLVWIMRFTNAILIIVTILYCLTMLFSLKISMLGRLGGINHITRAFFLSLLMLVLLLPWQRIFNGYIMGAIFTPEEFVKWHAEKGSDIIDLALYYMRFSGYMILVFLLFIMSQIRSGRWAKAILRRLEII